MKFNKIDINHWERKEVFHHFLNQQTSFSITKNIDITELYNTTKEKGYKFYPTFIFFITHIANSNEHVRRSFNSEGALGYWEKVVPMYTIFDKSSTLFSALSTNTDTGFQNFYANYIADTEKYSNTGKMFPQITLPKNIINISMIPWTSFTGFTLNVNNSLNYLLPIVTAGEFIKNNKTIYLPLSLQVHHAVCDGYHAALFMNKFQTLANHPQELLK